MKTVDIAMICDKDYIMQTCTAITSMAAARAEGTSLRIHVIAVSCTEENVLPLYWISSPHTTVLILHAEDEPLMNLHRPGNDPFRTATPAALFKFRLPGLLPELDKVLYLDERYCQSQKT